jgi:2-iminobutanoate/2-iminopropanoate deaminase
MSKTIIHTNMAPAAVGPYSQAVATTGAKTIYLSGQIGLIAASGELVTESFEAQVKQAFQNMTAVIQAAGADLSDVVKLTLYVTDLNNFSKVNQIMATVIPEPFPARSTIEVSGLPKGADFEVEAIVVC